MSEEFIFTVCLIILLSICFFVFVWCLSCSNELMEWDEYKYDLVMHRKIVSDFLRQEKQMFLLMIATHEKLLLERLKQIECKIQLFSTWRDSGRNK